MQPAALHLVRHWNWSRHRRRKHCRKRLRSLPSAKPPDLTCPLRLLPTSVPQPCWAPTPRLRPRAVTAEFRKTELADSFCFLESFQFPVFSDGKISLKDDYCHES